jgi:hypothetical protein
MVPPSPAVATARVPLPLLPGRLAEGYDGQPPPYRAAYYAAMDGKIPATLDRGRWYVAEGDLARIAAMFGMRPKAAPTPPRGRRKALSDTIAA